MRALKLGAIISLALVVVMVLMVGYLFLTAEVEVTSVTSHGVSAGDYPQDFENLKNAVTEETFAGTLYQKPTEWKAAGDYVFLDYTLRIRNGCLLPIDLVEVQVVPQPTDILQVGDLQPHALAAKTEGDLSARILAPKDSHPVRELIVTYYVWGVSFSLKTTYAQ